MPTIKFDLQDVQPLLSSLGIGKPADPIPTQNASTAGLIPPVPAAPPPPPPPVPAAAGFGDWSGDPQNLKKVADGMTAPGTPLIATGAPPLAQNAPPPAANAGGLASLNPPPARQFASLNPPGAQAPAVADVSGMARLNPLPAPLFAPPAQPNVIPAAAQPAAPQPQPLGTRLAADQAELQRLQTNGAGLNQIKNPVLKTLARIGDVAGTVLAPGVAAAIPGTTVHNWTLQKMAQGRVAGDAAGLDAQAKLADTQSQTDERNAYAVKDTAMANAIPQQLQLKRNAAIQLAAKSGQILSYDDDGVASVADDPNSQAFKDRQALAAMHTATADKEQITSEIAKNHYVPGTPEYAEAQRKLSQADQRLHVAMAGLGLRAEGLQLRKQNTQAALYGTDLNGNPLPGSTEISDNDGNTTVVGQKNAGHAIAQQKTVASFNDLGGSIKNTRQALNTFFSEGGSLSDPAIVAAMSDPKSTIGKVINGKLVQGNLSPSAIAAINAVRQLHEQAGILRSTTGGTASEAGAQRILDTAPNSGDANDVALNKLDQQEAVLGRLTPGQARVSGGLTVGGKPAGTAAPTRTTGTPPMQSAKPAGYTQTATGPGGHKIGTNDGGSTWFDVKTGKRVQ